MSTARSTTLVRERERERERVPLTVVVGKKTLVMNVRNGRTERTSLRRGGTAVFGLPETELLLLSDTVMNLPHFTPQKIDSVSSCIEFKENWSCLQNAL